ncbi:MAG: chaperone modulatory protein CbpM [Paracoccaceae bacterium]|jgi:chaperone modulatory protein CbpM
MTHIYSEIQVVEAVSSLTQIRLTSFVEAGFVQPMHTGDGPVFGQIDLARLDLLCELSDRLDLEESALEIVMSLVDQLHGVRAELRAVLDALAAEPDEVRVRIADTLSAARLGA